MNDKLIPFNNQVIPTKTLTSIGIKNNDINKLLKEGTLERIRRGFYKVTITYEVDTKLMMYYLMNNMFDEFLEYYENLPIKDYEAYYYRFMYDIMLNNYTSAYKNLVKCCELNKEKHNKINLYAYVLLLHELMNLSNRKLATLRNKIFHDAEDSLKLFLECIIREDYNGAYKNLRLSRDNKSLSKLEVKVLRNLSIKALECYNKKTSPEMEEYHKIYNMFYECICHNDYEGSSYYFSKVLTLSKKMGLKDPKLNIINNLFKCFNYIVEHQEIDLITYKTNYRYRGKLTDNFYQALKYNDYINALKFVNKIVKENDNQDFKIYQNLLERIYNFLNIRSVIKERDPRNQKHKLNRLIKDKRYKEALDVVAQDDKMNNHDRNIIMSLLESLLSLEDDKA